MYPNIDAAMIYVQFIWMTTSRRICVIIIIIERKDYGAVLSKTARTPNSFESACVGAPDQKLSDTAEMSAASCLLHLTALLMILILCKNTSVLCVRRLNQDGPEIVIFMLGGRHLLYCLRNNQQCVGRGVKLYSLPSMLGLSSCRTVCPRTLRRHHLFRPIFPSDLL